MKFALCLTAALLFSASSTANAQRVRDVSETVALFQGIPAVAPYFQSAYGYAVWPRIGRGGLGIGASRGRGQVYVNGYGAGGGIELPFGGFGKSGHGREKGFEALYGFSALKTVAAFHG